MTRHTLCDKDDCTKTITFYLYIPSCKVDSSRWLVCFDSTFHDSTGSLSHCWNHAKSRCSNLSPCQLKTTLFSDPPYLDLQSIMRVLTGSLRAAYLIFFASHIPITLLVDAQGAFSTWYPQRLRDLVAWYCDVFGDVLMRYPSSAPWFQALIMGEVCLQLPFFIVAIYVMTTTTTSAPSNNAVYPRWFQTLCIIYGSHVSTTLVPILATFSTTSEMTTTQIAMTMAVYSPYLIFPLGILYLAAVDDLVVVSDGRKRDWKRSNRWRQRLRISWILNEGARSNSVYCTTRNLVIGLRHQVILAPDDRHPRGDVALFHPLLILPW